MECEFSPNERGASRKYIMQEAERCLRRLQTDRNLDLVERLDAIAERKGCSMAQLAIAWLLSHDVVSSVIAGVTKMEQLEDNAKAPSVELTREDLKELDEVSAG